jgi:hypothetical protein
VSEERAESAWLLAREHDPLAPPPSPAIARDYEEIESLLGALPAEPSDDSWHDEVLLAAASATPSRPWWRRRAYQGAMGGGLIAAAAAGVMVLRPSVSGTSADELELTILHQGQARGDSRSAALGDHAIVRARPRGAGELRSASELRVYRADGALVAGCPEGPGCIAAAPGEHALEVALDAPVQYYVVLAVGVADRLPDGPMNAYLDAARAAHVRTTHQVIDVR